MKPAVRVRNSAAFQPSPRHDLHDRRSHPSPIGRSHTSECGRNNRLSCGVSRSRFRWLRRLRSSGQGCRPVRPSPVRRWRWNRKRTRTRVVARQKAPTRDGSRNQEPDNDQGDQLRTTRRRFRHVSLVTIVRSPTRVQFPFRSESSIPATCRSTSRPFSPATARASSAQRVRRDVARPVVVAAGELAEFGARQAAREGERVFGRDHGVVFGGEDHEGT